jgi:hypothetical protein
VEAFINGQAALERDRASNRRVKGIPFHRRQTDSWSISDETDERRIDPYIFANIANRRRDEFADIPACSATNSG